MQPNLFYPSTAASNPYAYQYNNYISNDSDIIWGQGEAGAKSYPVQPGHKKLIMDSEANRFFLKEVDINGIPLPLRIFEYTEVTPQPQATQPTQPVQTIDMSAYATKEEINEVKDLILGLKEDINNKNRNNRRDNKVNNG